MPENVLTSLILCVLTEPFYVCALKGLNKINGDDNYCPAKLIVKAALFHCNWIVFVQLPYTARFQRGDGESLSPADEDPWSNVLFRVHSQAVTRMLPLSSVQTRCNRMTQTQGAARSAYGSRIPQVFAGCNTQGACLLDIAHVRRGGNIAVSHEELHYNGFWS